MRYTTHSLSTVLVCFALTGCAQPRAFKDLWIEERPYQAHLESIRPPKAVLDPSPKDAALPAQIDAPSNPTGEITLRDAVGLALMQNHGLKASGLHVTAAEADAVQAALPPNPRVSIGAENFAGPEAGETLDRQTLRLSQVIELAGKPEKRLALGQATQRLRAWDHEQQRLDVAAQTASRYIAVVVAQERVALVQQQLRLSESVYDVADDRVTNGVAPALERDQAAVRVALSKLALEKARQNLVARRADLAAMWGSDAPAFTAAQGELGERAQTPALETLKQVAAQAPAVARWDDEIAQRLAALDLAKANAVQDPTLSAGVRYFPDAEDVAGVANISVPLAVFDDKRFGILSARLAVARTRAMKDQAVSDAHAALARGHARLTAASYAADMLDADALPAATAAFDAARAAYEAGQRDVLTLLDAERSLLELQNQQLDIELDYHQALIELERLTGQGLRPSRQ